MSEDPRSGTGARHPLRHWPKRLSFRVPFLVLLWLVPHFFDIAGHPLTDKIADPYREACIGALIVAFGAWWSKQGRRQPKDGNGGDKS